MARVIYVLIVTAIVIMCTRLASAEEKPCPGKNQVYWVCGGACPRTCEKPTGGPCIKVCRKGCQCKPGFVLDKNGDCIALNDCFKDGANGGG